MYSANALPSGSVTARRRRSKFMIIFPPSSLGAYGSLLLPSPNAIILHLMPRKKAGVEARANPILQALGICIGKEITLAQPSAYFLALFQEYFWAQQQGTETDAEKLHRPQSNFWVTDPSPPSLPFFCGIIICLDNIAPEPPPLLHSTLHSIRSIGAAGRGKVAKYPLLPTPSPPLPRTVAGKIDRIF